MQNSQKLRDEIISGLDTLPLDGLKRLAEFLVFLRNQFKQHPAHGLPPPAETTRPDVEIPAEETEKQSGISFLMSIAGQGKSGQHDVSERDEDILAQEINTIRGWHVDYFELLP